MAKKEGELLPLAGISQSTPVNSATRFNLQREIDQLILNRYAPVGVVVNDQMEILQLRGDTAPYLSLAPGTSNLNLLATVNAGLLMDIRTAMFQAQTQNISVRQPGIQVESGDPGGIGEAARSRVVNLEVIPVQSADFEPRYFLVLFEEASLLTQTLSPILPEGSDLGDWERENIRLRQALAAAEQEKTVAQAYLQAMIQEQENLNQDLRVVNEEILSSNEELQNTQEELQTAKEEIQSSKTIQNISSLNPLSILGDGDRLQQVLWNLLSNAIKFTPSGGQVAITLEALPTHAEIRGRDTGQGIQADLLPDIFDRFRQGDSSTTNASQGLGLGLSIVQQLVELHGGTVQSESLGAAQGTTMTVRLPLQLLPPEPTPPSDPELTVWETPPADSSDINLSLQGLHVLVVDDQVDTREMFQFVLETYGAEVQAVASAKAALAALSESPNRYDVLISDIGMPEENGYFLIQQIRLLPAEAGGRIPAVALTGYASEQERQLAIAAGFQAHLAKPVELEQLVRMVATLTGQA